MLLTDLDKLIPLGPLPKVKSRLIATLLPAIEAAIACGFTHVQVHALLVERGLAIDFSYYEDVIYRLRKKRVSVANAPMAGVPSGAASFAGAGNVEPRQDMKGRSGAARLQKQAELPAAFGSATLHNSSNIHTTRISGGKDKFHPINSRDFNIKDI